MPRKPMKPCAYPNCPNLTDKRYCKEHQSEMNRIYDSNRKDKNHNKKYGRCWKRIRDSYVKEHPFCEMCLKMGHLVKVEEVHHKLPLNDGGTHDRSNLISLCKSCHAKIHGKRG